MLTQESRKRKNLNIFTLTKGVAGPLSPTVKVMLLLDFSG
jgi:hypothetical protein